MNKNLFALALLAACGGKTDYVGGDDDGDDTGAVVCDGMPKVDHDEFRDAQQGGVAVLIEADVVADPTEGCEGESLVGVWLYYKTATDSDYRTPIRAVLSGRTHVLRLHRWTRGLDRLDALLLQGSGRWRRHRGPGGCGHELQRSLFLRRLSLGSSDDDLLSFVLPAYNEAENIEAAVKQASRALSLLASAGLARGLGGGRGG